MGYVIVDHSASIPSIQRQYGGKVIEYDSFQCKHCGGVGKVLHRQHTGLYCMPCGGPVHDRPQCATHREHFMQRIERQVARINFLAKLGIYDNSGR